jgi:hypothetical protein
MEELIITENHDPLTGIRIYPSWQRSRLHQLPAHAGAELCLTAFVVRHLRADLVTVPGIADLSSAPSRSA